MVKTILNIIEPKSGKIFDPAVGSAGMFVQTAHFIENEALDANIVKGNSFYEDKHELVGKCSFVMANPPFKVDGVDLYEKLNEYFDYYNHERRHSMIDDSIPEEMYLPLA